MEPGWFQITLKALLYDPGGRLLILKDTESQAGDFPGGRLGTEELYGSWEEALRREIKEELGHHLVLDLETEPFFFFPHRIINGGYAALCFCYRGLLQSGSIVLSAEHDSFDWVDPQQYDPSGLFRGTLLSFWPAVMREAMQSGPGERTRL